MLKIIGFICILTGCTGLGLCLSYTLTEKILEIKEVCNILNSFEQEIHFHRSTFQEACRSLKDRYKEPYNKILEQASGKIELSSGKAFGEVWKTEVENNKSKMKIPESIYSILYQLFDNCYVNPETQLEELRKSRNEMEKILHSEESEEKNKGKMYVCLGAATGVLGIIILL